MAERHRHYADKLLPDFMAGKRHRPEKPKHHKNRLHLRAAGDLAPFQGAFQPAWRRLLGLFPGLFGHIISPRAFGPRTANPPAAGSNNSSHTAQSVAA